MDFRRESLIAEGFEGFVTFEELRSGRIKEIPEEDGVYVILRPSTDLPMFLETSRAGKYKGKDPTEDIEPLERKWVPEAYTIYIGKSESKRGKLRKRIKLLSDFGMGKPVAHRGGRRIWQIEDSQEFIVAWKVVRQGDTAKYVEARLQHVFFTIHGRLPFGNRKKETLK